VVAKTSHGTEDLAGTRERGGVDEDPPDGDLALAAASCRFLETVNGRFGP
jgi:hypothetical protein